MTGMPLPSEIGLVNLIVLLFNRAREDKAAFRADGEKVFLKYFDMLVPSTAENRATYARQYSCAIPNADDFAVYQIIRLGVMAEDLKIALIDKGILAFYVQPLPTLAVATFWLGQFHTDNPILPIWLELKAVPRIARNNRLIRKYDYIEIGDD